MNCLTYWLHIWSKTGCDWNTFDPLHQPNAFHLPKILIMTHKVLLGLISLYFPSACYTLIPPFFSELQPQWPSLSSLCALYSFCSSETSSTLSAMFFLLCFTSLIWVILIWNQGHFFIEVIPNPLNLVKFSSSLMLFHMFLPGTYLYAY